MGNGVERGVPVRLLLVEDSENDAMLLLRELRRGGYEPVHEQVCTPEGMKRALEEAEGRGEPYEVVVSDYYMPRFGAPDALALLRRLGHDVPFIVVSGKVGEDAAVGIMKAGADDYVTKENMARLCPAIERELKEAEVRRERARAEEALARSEIRFRRLVEQAADAVFVHDLEGRLVDVNRRACESLGYAREELLGMSVSDVEVDHDHGSLKGLWEEISSGEPVTLEGAHRRKDGSAFPVEVRIGVFEDGVSPLVLALARDVTERKEAEKRAKETEARYRTLVEQIPAVTYVQEPFGDKRVTYVSPQTESVFGYPADRELLDPGHWLNIMHPDDRERVILEDERTDRTGETFRAEYRQFASDGKLVWIRDEATLVRDDSGRPLYWQGVQYDVTEERLAEEGLRRSEERYRTFIGQSSEGIWRFELEGPMPVDLPEDEQLDHFYRHAYLAECNDAMARMYGFEGASDLVGARVGDLLPRSEPENVEFMRAAVRAAYRLRDGESRETDREGNKRVILNNLSGVVEDGRLVRIWGTQRDVTEQKAAEEALRESRESLQAILDNTTAVIYVKDVEGRYSLVNRRFEELFDLSKEEVLGKTDLDLFSKEAANEYRRNDLAVLESGGPMEAEETVHREEGALTFISVKFPLMSSDGAPYATCGISTDITSRKRTEQDLKASEERFRATFEQASVGVALVGMDGKMMRVNRKLGEILGYDAAELTGMNVAEVTHPEDLSADLDIAGRTLAGEMDDYSLEKRYVRKDGEVVWANVAASLVRNDGGEPEYFIGAVEDITERRWAEHALREAEERYRTLLEGLPAVTYVRHVGSDTLSYASPQLEGVLGYGPKEYLSDPDLFARTIHPDDRGRVLAEDKRTNGTGEPFAVECRRITKDGRVVWVHDEAHLVKDAEGSPLYWQGFITDITDRKRAEEALRQSEELYRSVVEQAVEGIFLLDVDTMRILEANAALGATLGYSLQELKGMSFYGLSAHDKQSIDRNVERTSRAGSVSLGVRQYRRKDGGLVDEEISISMVPYEGRPVMCVVAHDVTERRRAERALGEIREAERNRIARELHDSILQDIVYALQEIQVLQIMGQNGAAAPGLGDAADALRRSVEGLRGAIFELRLKESLDTSFVQSLENLVDLNRRMARGAYEVDLVVGEGVPPGLPERQGRELVRIVQEALTNVRRHSGARRARVELGAEGEVLRVEVSDDGRGFDPGRSRVGVGRHSMRQRSSEIGGELEIRSNPGRGTRVLCRVPLDGQQP